MEQHASPICGKRKRKLLFELEKKESKKLKFFKIIRLKNQSPQYNYSRQSQSSEIEETLPGPGNWTTIYT